MFKVICDLTTLELNEVINLLPKGRYAPAAMKHNKVIKYKNCKPCGVDDFKLTSTSKHVTESQAKDVSDVKSMNFLSPINPNYYKAYDDILNQDASKLSNFKYINLFVSDRGLAPNYEGLTNIYEMIIDASDPQKPFTRDFDGYESGYKKYYAKAIYVEITNATHSTFLSFGAFEGANRPGHFIITHPMATYALRYKGTLDCPAIKSQANTGDGYFVYGDQIYSRHGQEYIKFLEKDLVERIQSDLESFKRCKVDNEYLVFMGNIQGDDFSYVQAMCEASGGKIESMQDTIVRVCAEQGRSTKLADNSVLAISCNNYKTYLVFDENGEIINAPLVSREFELQLPHYHNEI